MAKALHTRMKIISRGKGHSAIAAAAYRSATNILDERATEIKTQALEEQARLNNQPMPENIEPVTHYYQRKSDVVHSQIMAPENAPEWVQEMVTDRVKLWNYVETFETDHNRFADKAQLAREFEGELSRHLDMDTNIKLAQAFVEEHFTSRGMIADLNIHNHEASDGEMQPHFHVMLTMRTIEETGFGNKNRDWNANFKMTERDDQPKLVVSVKDSLRADLADRINAEHEAAGIPIRIDPRSYKEQGIDAIPGIYLGKEAFHLEQQGVITRRGNQLRGIKVDNTMKDFARSMAQEPIEEEVESTTLQEHLRELSIGLDPTLPKREHVYER